MLSTLADLHHDFVHVTTNDSLVTARAQGRTGGRPPKLNDDQAEKLRQLHTSGTPTPLLARKFDVSRASVYRLLSLSDLETRATDQRELRHQRRSASRRQHQERPGPRAVSPRITSAQVKASRTSKIAHTRYLASQGTR